MKNNLNRLITVFLLSIAMITLSFAEGVEKGKRTSLKKTVGSPSVTMININNVSTYIEAIGTTDHAPNGNSGFEFPKGSNKQVIYESGFVFGTHIGGSYASGGEWRIGGSTYRSSLTSGRILPDGTPHPESASDNRIYRVRPDFKTGSMTTEMKLEGVSDEEARKQYEKDWLEWPAAWGAPFKDVDNNGVYNPSVDIPGVDGASQTVWWVANDFDNSKSTNMYGAASMKMEVQCAVWAYALDGPLGNMIFRRYKVTNKSTDVYQDSYVCWWSDPDNGDAFNDAVGCDTTLSLGYVYNGTSYDGTYGGNPPAVGFDYFQGPKIPGLPTDTAIFNNKKVAGFKNLPMTAFFFFTQGNAAYSDPTLGNYTNGALKFRNLMQGKIGNTGAPMVNPKTGKSTMFAFSGDPVSKTGWIDGIEISYDDRRLGMVSGPFNMQPGETQEIVVAAIAAGASPGIDNLKAINLLKSYDRLAQKAYNDFFVVPTAPEPPKVKVSELDREIVFNWGWDLTTVEKTESYNLVGFEFEGYNVYQLPTRKPLKAEAKRIATFDKVNSLGVILGNVTDPESGAIVTVAQQLGSNSGLQRYFRTDFDYINNEKLINGKSYYYAITAYVANPSPDADPNNIENSIAVIEVKPHSEDPGTIIEGKHNNVIASTHVGPANASTDIKVIDPIAVTGNSYEISFKEDTTDPDILLWDLKNTTTNKVLLSNVNKFKAGPDAPIAEGLKVDIDGNYLLSHDYDDILVNGKSLTYSGSGVWWYEGATQAESKWTLGSYARFGYTNYAKDGFNGFMVDAAGHGYGTSDKGVLMQDIELRWTGEYETQTIGGKAYKVVKSGGQMATLYQTSLPGGLAAHPLNPNPGVNAPFLMRIPCEVWNAETNTQINIAVRQREHQALDPLEVWSSAVRMYAEVINSPYNAQAPISTVEEKMKASLNINFTKSGFVKGDIVRLVMNNPLTAVDKFTFKSPKVTYDIEKAKLDVEKINVFPNPYYGYNTQELNKYQRFVTFNHLPKKATIKIVNLAGQIVRIIEKDDTDQHLRWNLANENGFPVGSGLYIAYVDMPELGKTKIVKFSIIHEKQLLDRY